MLLRELVGRSDAQLEILREIRDELRTLRAEFRRREAAAAPLIAALCEEFDSARFTVAGILELAGAEPDGALADALGAVIDMHAAPRSRATALGALLRRLPELEIVAQQRGVAVYRLRTSPE